MREAGADLGISFDGDADRAAFIDETGEPIGSDLMTGLIGGELLEREPGKAVVYDLRSSRAVAEYIEEKGGVPVRERVGHSFIKATLRKREAIFGGELAGHYYFRDHSYADCPLLSVVEVLNLHAAGSGKPLSALVAAARSATAKSQEINFEVEDKQGKMDELARTLRRRRDRLPRRHHHQLSRLVGQRPPLEHRALPAPGAGGEDARELEQRKEELFGILGHPAE